MAFKSHPHILVSILLYYKICHRVTAEESFVYSCCPLQNTFNGEYCPETQPSTEFDMFHEGRWLVSAKFRQNETDFQLSIVPRNLTNGHCKSNFNITYPSLREDEYITQMLTQKQISESQKNVTSEIFPKFFSNGTMIYKNKFYYPMEYCFDSLSQDGNTIFSIAVSDGGCRKQVYEVAASGIRQPYRKKWINQLFAAVAGLSFLFTLFNVIIYLSLRNFLNVSGWVEFAYFLALGVFSLLSIPAFLYESTSDNDDTLCYVLSAALQFAEIMINSSYILIALDVYWMLRKSDTFGSYGEEIEESKFRLIFYYLFLLAVPIGVTTYGIILNLEYAPEELTLASVASYGEKSCFAPTWIVSEYLLFGLGSATLLIILLSVNHIFARLSASADIEDAPRVSLLSNMFFFTLTYWVVDLLKFSRPLLSAKRSQEETSNETFWILLESFTYAQGILAFIVFIFNRKTLKAFRKKAGTDGTLKEIFRHACCSDGTRVDPAEDATPMSPLMKSSSMRRSTVRQNHLY